MRLWRIKRWTRRSTLLIMSGVILTIFVGGGAYAALFGGSSSQSSTSINLQKGLVGWWKLDGNGKDSTPYANNPSATVGAPSVTTDRKGISGKAINFSGSGQSYSYSSAVSNMPTSALSVSFWVNQTSQAGFTDWFNNHWGAAPSSWGWDTYTDVNGMPVFGLWEQNQTQTVARCSNGTITTGVWHHVVGTYDGTTIKLYVDNVLCATTGTNAGATLYTGSGTFSIGDTSGGGHQLDDVRMYNRALSTSEVKALFQQYGSGVKAASGENGLVGWWKLDGNAKDATPNANDGTITGAQPTSDRKGIANKAYNFSSSTHKIDIGSAATTTGMATITASAWVNASSNTAFATAVGRWDNVSPSNGDWLLGIASAGQFRFSLQIGGATKSVVSTTGFSTNTWHHLAGIYDGTTMVSR